MKVAALLPVALALAACSSDAVGVQDRTAIKERLKAKLEQKQRTAQEDSVDMWASMTEEMVREQAASFKLRASDEVDPQGYKLMLDGTNVQYVPRQVWPEGAPASVVWTFPLDQSNPIETNSTHAFLPMNVLVQAGYARDFPAIGTKQQGLSNQMWFMNPQSILTDRPYVASGQKEHTMSHSGPWSTSGTEEAAATFNDQNILERGLATAAFGTRNDAVAAQAVTGGTGSAVTHCGVAPPEVENTRNFCQGGSTEGVAEKFASSQFQEMSSNAEAGLAAAATQTSLASNDDCFHMEQNDGLLVEGDKIAIPLGVNIVSYRGQGTFAPMRNFDLFAGIVVWTVEGSALKQYFLANQYFHLNMQPTQPTGPNVPANTYFVGPTNGVSGPVSSTDGRDYSSSGLGDNILNKFAIGVLNNVAEDFTAFYGGSAAACTSAQRAKFKSAVDASSSAKELGFFTDPDGVKALMNVVATQGLAAGYAEAKSILAGIKSFANVRCAANFLMTDNKNANTYNPLELLVWAHFLVETTSSMSYFQSTQTWWNDGVTLSF